MTTTVTRSLARGKRIFLFILAISRLVLDRTGLTDNYDFLIE